MQVLRQYVRINAIDDFRARQALTDLVELDLNRYPHEPLLPRIWALRDHLTAYSALASPFSAEPLHGFVRQRNAR